MSKGIIGKKIGMTQIFDGAGRVIPVTVVEAGPCFVIQVKSEKTDGYNSIQLGFSEKASRKLLKPEAGHLAKAGITDKGFYYVKEFRVSAEELASYQQGGKVELNAFSAGEKVKVTGFSKGRGFAGVIKRHGQHQGPNTHGGRMHRTGGSIGATTSPGRVFKNMPMAGRMGCDRVTIRDVEIVGFLPDRNQMLLKGPLPGHPNGIVYISNN